MPHSSATERYVLQRSPFAQRPTQRKIADLLMESRDDLRRFSTDRFKESFIVRRDIIKKGKVRHLAYPEGRLRAVHERIKFHLSKVTQPSYLFSPRRGFSQRQNAYCHIDQTQFLTVDLKGFYPSTTLEMVRDFFTDELGMYPDVAGLLAHIATVNGTVSLGSPLTPVLCSLVHRSMFDSIADLCSNNKLCYSVWVDDLTISGDSVPGDVASGIREIVRARGLRSHKIQFRSGNRAVFITGIGVVGSNLVAPNALHIRLRDLWTEYHQGCETAGERDLVCEKLLCSLGTLRYISGPRSPGGMTAADRMNSLRQERAARQRKSAQLANDACLNQDVTGVTVPF